MANEVKRVILLGFDGADPLILQKLLGEGKLPHIAQFIERGATTEDLGMTGVVPTVTPPGWCTIATGSHPGTHGWISWIMVFCLPAANQRPFGKPMPRRAKRRWWLIIRPLIRQRLRII